MSSKDQQSLTLSHATLAHALNASDWFSSALVMHIVQLLAINNSGQIGPRVPSGLNLQDSRKFWQLVYFSFAVSCHYHLFILSKLFKFTYPKFLSLSISLDLRIAPLISAFSISNCFFQCLLFSFPSTFILMPQQQQQQQQQYEQSTFDLMCVCVLLFNLFKLDK